MDWAVLYPKYIWFSLTLNSKLAQGSGRGLGGVNRVWLRTLNCFPLRRKKGSCPVFTWKKNVFWAKAIEWITVLNIWNKRYEKVLCMFISWWKILTKFLQWPCNEPLNALRATSTRKRNCLHRKTSFLHPGRKKVNHMVRKWQRKDCVTLTKPRLTSCA